jgi:hypothetical protein
MPLPAQDPMVAFVPAPRVPTEVLATLSRRPPLVPDPPGPTDIRRDNPRHQGEIGLSDAIGWFGRRGLTVSVPLADNQPYDLVVDIDGCLARVQVKTATGRSPYGRFLASLETAGGNQSFHTRKPFDAALVEVVYVLTDDGDRYLIPSAVIEARRTISLGVKWQSFRAVEPSVPGLPDTGP